MMRLIKRKLWFLVLLIDIALLLSLSSMNIVKADITVTRTFTSSNSDGYTYASDSTYKTVNDALTGSVSTSAVAFLVGQAVPSNYEIYRGFVFFDTSTIPSTATLTSATLSLYVSSDASTVDFNVTIQNGMPTYPHEPLVAGDYYRGWYSSSGGSRNTTTIVGVGYWNITLSTTGLSWVNDEGYTKFCLRSSIDIAAITPTGNEYVAFSANEIGSTQTPLLIVTYTSPTGYGAVTIHGPYLETGAVYNGVVYVTVYYPTNTSETYELDGTDGVADIVSTTSDVLPSNIYWNLTSDFIKQRVYNFNPLDTADEVWLHVADTTIESVNQYYVSVTDFAGLTGAYIYTLRNVNGTTRIMEKQPLDVMNNIPFWLITYSQYTLKIISDQGTFTWNLPADTIGTKSFIITKDMVTQVSTARNFTVQATRLNGTVINIEYYDPTSSTVSVTTAIKYYSNYIWNTAYTQTDYSNDIDFNWTSAESTREYVVVVTATFTDETLTWQFGLGIPEPSNLFSTSLNLFGEWGFPANQVPGIIIAGLFFGLLSWRDTEIGCGIGLAVTALLCIVGLLDVPVMAIAMGFMLVIFMYLHKGKETLRYPP